jgi:diguanylate cyclase (GGDEF)-like protein
MFATLGTAVVSLAWAIVGMFLARTHLLEASELVRHTFDVELSIAACRVHIREAQVSVAERPALIALARADAERIRWLTLDNPLQQLRVERLMPQLQAFAGGAADASRIDESLRELEGVESLLKDLRMNALEQATRTGWLISSTCASLTVVLVGLLLGTLYRQSRALTLAHANLQREAAMLESVVDSMVDGIMAITPSRAFLHVNRSARRLLGDDFPADSFPKDWRSNIECIYEDGTEMKPEDGALSRAIAGASTDNLVYRARQRSKPDDPGTWLSATARPVRGPDGVVIAGVVALRDITEQRRQQEQLRAMSMSDELTRLHNRRGFLMLAEQHVRAAQREGTPCAIVFTDVNGLKAVNDSFGHDAGDQLIRSAADVLRVTFRESDIIARLGGDEFVALLGNSGPATHGTIVARLTAGIDEHNAYATPVDRLSLSVGITFFDPERPLPLPDLMVEADRLMYADKDQQRRVRDRGPRLVRRL